MAKPTVESDALTAIAAGDFRSALTILMNSYGEDLYRHVRLVVARDDLADEVHQAIFIQAYRDLPRFAGRATLRTWLYAIARHRCLDALKLRRRFLRRFLTTETLPERADPGLGADERIERVAVGAALEACLGRLPPKVRIAVLLRFQEGLSYEEMAGICNERSATLQARVTRALPKLRGWLEEMGMGVDR
jgi:RNA polymerase sigma-70 factor (ECF subfamily)